MNIPMGCAGVQIVACPSHEAWLAERRKSIGSSDAAAIVGASPWRTELDVYLDKAEASLDSVESEEMEWGHELEDPVARVFARRTGLSISTPPPFTLYRREELQHAHASPDRFLADPKRTAAGVLEVKTTSGFKAEEWEPDVPLHVQVQVQHQLLVLGLRWAFATVLIGGQRMRSFEIAADPLFHEALEAQIAAFWRRVEAREPPEPRPERDYEAVRRLFSRALAGKRVPVDSSLVETWIAAREARLAAEKAEKVAAVPLMAAIGDAEFGESSSGLLVKWASEIREMPAQPAKTIELRPLRLLKSKGGSKP